MHRAGRLGAASGLSVAAVALLLVSLTACQAPVQQGLDEAAANELLAALERSGIAAEKAAESTGEANRYAVRVANADVARAVGVLRAAGLPRNPRHGFAEVYGKPSLIPTASEERARYLDAMAGEIARTLESVEGVLAARVHLVLPDSDPLSARRESRTPARAAVLLKTRPGTRPLPEVDVQRLVAGSAPGLEPQAVTVVITSAPAEPQAATLAALGPVQLAAGGRRALVVVAGIFLSVLAVLAALLLLAARRLGGLRRSQRIAMATPPASPLREQPVKTGNGQSANP